MLKHFVIRVNKCFISDYKCVISDYKCVIIDYKCVMFVISRYKCCVSVL